MWTDVTAWLASAAAARLISGVLVPVLAVVLAAAIALVIARRSVRDASARADRAAAAQAIALVLAASSATRSGRSAKRLRTRADVALRLLPQRGAAEAATWVAAALDAAAPQDDVRDRLLVWVNHPRRAARLFAERPVPPQPAPAPALAASPPPASTAPEPPHARHALHEMGSTSSEDRPAPPGSQPHPPAHRDRPGWLDHDDDAVAVGLEAEPDAASPPPVAAMTVGDRRRDGGSLIPVGAVPVTKVGHRTPR